MNSAAKLRKRSVATLAASALIIGGVAPAAFAWTAVTPAPAAANQAGAASIGVIDANDAKDGTQGATVVAPGDTNAAIGDVRFVIPSTFQRGDVIDFVIGDGGNLSSTLPGSPTPSQAQIDANLIAQRVSFASQPAVSVDSTPYAATTHVQGTSPVSTANTAVAGSVEAGKEAKYSGAGTPVAPQFTVSLASTGTNQFNNVVRVTITNDSDPNVTGAKFIGAINGAKVNVGSLVTPNRDLGLTARAGQIAANGAFTPDADLTWWGDTTGDDTTYPATISTARLEVSNGAVMADGTAQFVGPLTVTSASGLAGNPVEVTLSNGTFDSAADVTATEYDADGKVVGTPTAGNVSVSGNTLSYSPTGAGTRKVVFTGAAVQTRSAAVTYTLSQVGGVTPPSGALGSTTGNNLAVTTAAANRNQTDIERSTSATETRATSTLVATRLGGQDRYQTAVKIAEDALGTNPAQGVRGESDNVVIASGEGFADALSAGYLAATKDASLILTRQGSLPQTDIEFLKTYGAKNIFIVGGYGSVGKAVEDQLRGLQSFDVQAADGATTTGPNVTTTTVTFSGLPAGVTMTGNPVSGLKEETAGTSNPVLSITRAAGTGAAGAADPADANTSAFDVTAVTLGGAQPISLVANNDNSATAVFAVGTGRVTVNIAATAAAGTTNLTRTATNTTNPSTVPLPADEAYGNNRKVVPLDSKLTVTRIAGNDRFETNKKVNMYAAESGLAPVGTTTPEYGKAGKKTAILANGMAPWDALAAGPLVGNDGVNPIPVILTRGDTMNNYAADQIAGLDIQHMLFIGSEGVIPASVAKETTDRGLSLTRLGGATRWATAKAVSEFALKTSAVSATNTSGGLGFNKANTNPYLANGGSIDGSTAGVAKGAWADALAAGPAAAKKRTIIALTDSVKLPQETKDLLSANNKVLDPVVALGLGAVVSTGVVNEANAAVAD